MVFLRKVTGKKARRKRYGSWRRAVSDILLQEAVTQLLQTYIDRRKATVAE